MELYEANFYDMTINRLIKTSFITNATTYSCW